MQAERFDSITPLLYAAGCWCISFVSCSHRSRLMLLPSTLRNPRQYRPYAGSKLSRRRVLFANEVGTVADVVSAGIAQVRQDIDATRTANRIIHIAVLVDIAL